MFGGCTAHIPVQGYALLSKLLLLFLLLFLQGANIHNDDDDMGSPIFSSTHVATNHISGKLYTVSH